MTHRLTRPLNFNLDDARKPPEYMNVISVDYKTANWIVLAVSGLIGLGFIAVIPAYAKMTPRSTAEELGILFCLMTLASPLARQYYFIWLFLPLTVIIHRAAFDDRPRVRTGTWGAICGAFLLMALSLPFFPKMLQAWGNNVAATVLIVAGLIWHMRHPPALLHSSLSESRR